MPAGDSTGGEGGSAVAEAVAIESRFRYSDRPVAALFVVGGGRTVASGIDVSDIVAIQGSSAGGSVGRCWA